MSMEQKHITSKESGINSSKPVLLSFGSSPASKALIDDDFEEDVCSICLEPFSTADPASATCCKHEYHLLCILEWSQRSEECPICWQSLALKDPAGQKLLAVAQTERRLRARRPPTHMLSSYSQNFGEHELEPDASDGYDFNEQIMQHLAAAMSRARTVHRSEKRRFSEAGPSHAPFFLPGVSGSNRRHSTYGSSRNVSPTSGMSSGIHNEHLPSHVPPVDQSDVSNRSRATQAQLQYGQTQKPRSSELLAFSESVRTRLSAASTRCKDSISKGTQGFREKFLSHNDSVKELSKGVQREMSSGIAGLSKMIDRLDIKSKRNGNSGAAGGTSCLLSKGKELQEDYPGLKPSEVAHDSCLDEHSPVTCPIASPDMVSQARRS